jgi:hypothetical protein
VSSWDGEHVDNHCTTDFNPSGDLDSHHTVEFVTTCLENLRWRCCSYSLCGGAFSPLLIMAHLTRCEQKARSASKSRKRRWRARYSRPYNRKKTETEEPIWIQENSFTDHTGG